MLDNLTVVIFSHKQIGVLLTGAELWRRMGVSDIRIYFPSNIRSYVESHPRREDVYRYSVHFIDILSSADINSSGYKETIADVATTHTANHILFMISDVWPVSPMRVEKLIADWVRSNKQCLFYWTQVGSKGYFFDVPSSDFFGVRDDAFKWLTKQQFEERFPKECMLRRNGNRDVHPLDPRALEATWQYFLEPLSWYEINTKETPYMQYGYKNFGIGHFHHEDIRKAIMEMSNAETGYEIVHDDPDAISYSGGLVYVQGYLRMMPKDFDENLHGTFMYACDTATCGNYLSGGVRRI